MTPDSIVPNSLSSQGWNRYTYVENNPVRYTDPSGHCGPLRTTLDGTVDALDIICQGAGGGSGITGEMIGKATAGATTITVGIGLETGVLEFPTMPPGVFSQDTTYPVGNICSEPGLLSGAPPVELPSFFPGPILEPQWPTQVPGIWVERPGVLGDNVLSTSTLQPGPYAGASIPARGPERDFTEAERIAIDMIGYSTGCHTCGTRDPGTRSGHFIPDHQPPSALNVNDEPQRLYPHCITCSRRQGGEVIRALR